MKCRSVKDGVAATLTSFGGFVEQRVTEIETKVANQDAKIETQDTNNRANILQTHLCDAFCIFVIFRVNVLKICLKGYQALTRVSEMFE